MTRRAGVKMVRARHLLGTAILIGVAALVGTGRPRPAAACNINNVGVTVGPVTNFAAIDCINIQNSTVNGNVTNTGTGSIVTTVPTPNTTPQIGIAINNSAVNGAIVNNGTIQAPLLLGNAPFAFAAGVGTGIDVFANATVTGGISNTGSITVNNGIANGTSGGILVQGTTSFAGGITNSGSILALNLGGGANAGIGIGVLGVSNFTGGITSSGQITAVNNAIDVENITNFAGGITSSGMSFALNNNIFVQNVASFTGGITNGAVMSASGITVNNVTNFAGGITNSGTITNVGDTANTGILVQNVVTFAGGIVNSGSITSDSLNPNSALNSTGISINNVSTAVTNTGVISTGVGILVTNGSGASVFNSGTITGASGTAINFANAGGNTLTLGPGFDITGNVIGTGNNTFQLGGAGNGTFNLSTIGATQQYQGFTSFNTVSGAWTAIGTFGQTQAWNIDGGTLLVAGSLTPTGGINVAGGVLGGTGTVSSTTVNSGVLAPGLPGTPGSSLNIAGNLVVNSGGAYQTDVSPTTANLARITGTAALNGTLDANGTGGAYTVGTKYLVLTSAGGIANASTLEVTGNFGSSRPVISMDANDLFLTLAPASLVSLLPSGAPRNAENIASAITAANVGTPPLAIQNLFSLPPTQLVNALTQISGEAATGGQVASFELTNSFLQLLTGPSVGGGGRFDGGPALPFGPEPATGFPPDVELAYAGALKAAAAAYTPRWNSWGTAFGGSTTTSGDPSGTGSHDLSARSGGFAAGLDYRVTPDLVLGMALAGGATNWQLSAGLGGGHSDVFLAALYASKQWGQAYLSGALNFSSSWLSTSRTIGVAGPDTLSAAFNALGAGGRLEGGYRIASWAAFNITPYAAVQVQSFWTPAYSESGTLGAGDPLALARNAQLATDVRTELGSRFDQAFALADHDSVNLFGRLAWAHDRQSNPDFTATFVGLPSATFVVNGAAQPANLALVTAGAEWRVAGGWSFMAKFDGEFASGSTTYTGTARVRYIW
jgi:uncharacterized protein with beta-barrel porin domain